MLADFDLVLRRGTIFDGSGRAPREADLAVKAGRIAAIGRCLGPGKDEINCKGLLVTPGFVDIHTHYDGQATWAERMAPSSNHGVTTIVTGNCGVGFAPCRSTDRHELVRLMEGVEDIPEIVMTEGLPWDWETFPDYLDFLADRRFDVDVAVQVPHSALRVYVMGKRGCDREPATEEDRQRMRSLVAEALCAGAIGCSTSRMLNHRTKAGEQAPSVNAAELELQALMSGLRDAGHGVFQIIPNVEADPEDEFRLMERLVANSGRPLSFTLMQTSTNPDWWKVYLRLLERRSAELVPIRAQVYPRPLGMLQGLDLSFHPFSLSPSYRDIAGLPHAEKLRAMRDPSLRARLLSEQPVSQNPFELEILAGIANLYPLGVTPVYNPGKDQSLAAEAQRRGVGMLELAYDLLLEQDGRALLYFPGANYADGNLDAVREMIAHPCTVIGLGDGGAHYGMLCDSSFTTYLLSWWTRDAPSGERLDLSQAIAALTREPARTVGLRDRGVITVGAKADLNVIDYDRLKLHLPQPTYDLPAGGRRIIQGADGYRTAIVNGLVTYRDGLPTGELPGRLFRAA